MSKKVTEQNYPNLMWDIAVLWPYATGLIFMIFGFAAAASVAQADLDSIPVLMAIFLPLVGIWYVITIVLFMVTYVYAIHRLYTQTDLDIETKRTWLILLVLFNLVTIPFLHFMQLRK